LTANPYLEIFAPCSSSENDGTRRRREDKQRGWRMLTIWTSVA
jgi:hypothetical protein